ncbi:hypothetical protein [Alteromonas macleodii]|uniref:hypothetical protein n=1 Tax=Alteromonas macleodii TaxID=28108 RepID=UPI0024A7AD91|nr:hypothetical protein [Alteromonas macleodii]
MEQKQHKLSTSENSIEQSVARYFDCFDLATRHMTFESEEEQDFVFSCGRESIFWLVCKDELQPNKTGWIKKHLPFLKEKYMGYKCATPTISPITQETFEAIENGSMHDVIILLSAIINKNTSDK